MSARPVRVALFSDCFHDINGVARTSRELEAFAGRRRYPFFSLHAGPRTLVRRYDSVRQVELKRSVFEFPLDAGTFFDPALLRYRGLARRALSRFRPDLVQITGPGDCGILGAILAHELGVPLVASWHTNLHEFGARRLVRLMPFLPAGWRRALAGASERCALDWTLRFYGIARMLLAPNDELVSLLRERTGKAVFLLRRGVDTTLFSPAWRQRRDDAFVIGYVGRLSPEKDVRVLAHLERALVAAGEKNFRFVIVGQGSEAGWLRANMAAAEFPGVLHGEALARAYADMDLFVFPSRTDAFGNVVQEALASGVPVAVTDGGGPKYLVRPGTTGIVASDERELLDGVRLLIRDPALRSRMGVAGRAAALAASWEAVFDGLFAAYASHLPALREKKVTRLSCPVHTAARKKR